MHCFQVLVILLACAYSQAGTCKDAKGERLCRYWRRFGACRSHAKRMQYNCAKSCQQCEALEKCASVNCTAPKYCTIDEVTKEPVCRCPQSCRHKRRKGRIGKVCGTDGKTYATICKLEESACNQEKTVHVNHYGACKTTECKDNQPEKLCKGWKKAGACKAYPEMLKKYCAKTCNVCSKRALSPTSCQNSVTGCCWDLKTEASGPNGQGCPVCKNLLRMCDRFTADCNSKSGSNRDLMRTKCPKTCNYC